MLAGAVSDNLSGFFEEILHVNVGLERCAGFTRNAEQGARRIDLAANAADLHGIGGIEHQQVRRARGGAERQAEHLGTQTRTTHAQQQELGEPSKTTIHKKNIEIMNVA